MMCTQALPTAAGPEEVVQTLPDGTRLAASIWRPDGPGPHPVLLQRQPYGRAIASTVTLAHPSWYAAQGYIVVVQDVRGAGDSEGAWDTLAHEAEDGAAACRWARDLPGSDGRLGLYGFSYHGMTQMLALAGGGAADAIVPVMAPWDCWADMASENGAFRLDWNLIWGAQMAALQARRAGDGAAFAALRAAAQAPALNAPRPALPEVVTRHAAYGHLPDWVAHAGDAAFWRRRSPARLQTDAPEALSTPCLAIGGWFDPFLTGTWATWRAFAAAGPARILVGPWSHLLWGGRSVDREVAGFLDRHLKGTGAEGPAVVLHDLTRGEWRAFDALPGAVARWHLGGDGLAAAGSAGRLAPEAPRRRSAETWVHDPWRPVPAQGLHIAAPFGLQDRADLDARADVAVFTSDPLTAPLRLAGPARLSASVTADAPSFDLHLTLSRVTPDGAATGLTSAMHRLAAAPGPLELRPVAATLEPGDRLRLSVAGAAFPAFAVNPGTGAAPETTPAHLHRPITLTLHTPATLDLTVAP